MKVFEVDDIETWWVVDAVVLGCFIASLVAMLAAGYLMGRQSAIAEFSARVEGVEASIDTNPCAGYGGTGLIVGENSTTTEEW